MGDGDGGQKSLRPENLVQSGAGPSTSGTSGGSSSTFVDSAKLWFRKASAQVTVWLAGYEWWQIALGVAVVALVIGAYLQNSSKYASRRSAGSNRHRSGGIPSESDFGSSRQRSAPDRRRFH